MNFDEKEEATCIKTLTYLEFQPNRAYLLFPILSVLSLFVLPILTYWKTDLRKYWFYKQVSKREEATHICIEGIQGNSEIQPMVAMEKGQPVDSFSYRFIKFKFNPIENKFKPIMYDIKKTHDYILGELSMGLN